MPRNMRFICPTRLCNRCFGRLGRWCWWTMKYPPGVLWRNSPARICASTPGSEQRDQVSITNWLSAARRRELTEMLGRPILFPALIEGDFAFEPGLGFPSPDLPVVVASPGRGHDAVVADPARTGLIAGRWTVPRLPDFPRDRSLAVIGTGEYAYTPFRIALTLEEQGYDVRFRSTTRSPILALAGDAIASRCEFPDNYGDGIPNLPITSIRSDCRSSATNIPLCWPRIR